MKTATLHLILWTLICGNAGSLTADSIPPLINYQGRLTDAAGAPLPIGTYGLAFRLWDKQSLSSEETLLWGREYDVTIVESGAFNVILGAPDGRALTDSPAPAVNNISFAFGESNRFLGLTITRDGSGLVVTSPKEFVPRQQILTVPFAFTAASVVPNSITSNSISPGAVLTANIEDGAITQAKRAPANIQISDAVNFDCNGCTGDTVVANLTVTLTTSGRPVFVGLVSGATEGATSYIRMDGAPEGRLAVMIFDGPNKVAEAGFWAIQNQASAMTQIPVSSVNHVYIPAEGVHTYTIKIRRQASQVVNIGDARLVAYEL